MSEGVSRRLIVLACLCLVTLAARAEPLAIAIARTPLSLPLYVAEARGYFAAEGLQPKTIDCIGGHRCLQLMLDGGADLATASDLPVMFNSFQRDDYVVLAAFATTTDDVKLIGRKDAGIGQPADLRGKKIGVVRGSSSHFFLDAHLLWHGVDPASVQLVDLQPDEMTGAMQSHQVAAVSAWEPFAYATIEALQGRAVVLPHAGIYTLSFNLVAQRRLAGTRDPELVKLLRAIACAEAFIRDRPLEAQAILRARLGVDQRFIDWVWPGLRFQLALDRSLVKTLESEARWVIREAHVAGKTTPNYLNYMHAAPLREVDATSVGLSR